MLLRAAGKAHTRCHISHAPEIGGVLSSDSAGRKDGHGLEGIAKKGTSLLSLRGCGSILIENLTELQTKSPTCFPDRHRDKDRQTTTLTPHTPSLPQTCETIICISKDVGDLTFEKRTIDITSLLFDIFFFVRYTIIRPNCLSYAEFGMMSTGYHYRSPASSSVLAVFVVVFVSVIIGINILLYFILNI